MLLHHELLTAPDATPAKAAVFLHGILGTGANLRSHARRFIQSCPDFLAVLIDLRAHGRSQGLDGPDTVDTAAADVAQTAERFSVPVHAVVGHSFGGKVALAFARAHPGLKAVMTLDSAPGPRLEARGSEGTLQVVTMLEALGRPWPDRDTFIAEVERRGQPRSLAQWLAMNLESRPEGWVFRLSLPRIHALLDDYFRVDLWPVVEQATRTVHPERSRGMEFRSIDARPSTPLGLNGPGSANPLGPRVHLVIGAKSNVYGPEDRARAHRLEAESGGHVTVDLLDAGHWVHVEDPQGLSEVLLRRLGP